MKHAPIRTGSDEESATPVDATAYAPPKPFAEMSEAEFDRWVETLPIPPGIRHIDDDDPEEDARIEADLAAGRFHPHSIVSKWFETFGRPDYKPFDEWLKSSG